MCSGRVDLSFVLRAFSNGIDGVFIGACHLNECNYITHGNYQAQNMVLLAKRILEYIGINPERLKINYMSGAEANVFVDAVNNFTKTIKGLGPLGIAEKLDQGQMKAKLAEVMKLVPYIKVALREKLTKRLDTPHEDVSIHKDYFTKEEIEKLFSEIPSYWIDPEKCQACMTCARRCPVEAIDSKKNMVHIINQDKCIKCGTCYEACPPRFAAVTKIVGQPVPPPIPEEKRTIVRKGKEKEVA